MQYTIWLAMVFAGVVGAAELTPDFGAVAFRFDDNQTIKKWTEMCAVFEKHHVPLCASWNTDKILNDKDYQQLAKKMVAGGHEVMDHTPVHNPFVVNISHLDQVEDAKVHHKDENNIYLDYKFLPNPKGKPFAMKVKKNVGESTGDIGPGGYILAQNLEDKKLYWLVSNAKTPNVYRIEDFWAKDGVDLGEKEYQFQRVETRKGFDFYPENIRFIVRCAKRNFEALGLPSPQCWIQPGGAIVFLSAEQLQSSLEAEGYISAGTYSVNASGKAPKFTCNPSWQLERYRMQWGDIHMEKDSVETAKTLIADGIARRRVMIAASHMIVRNYAGGWQKFLEAHDELLGWMKENQIPIVTQSALAKAFYSNCLQISGNLLPDLKRDLDGNGRPDGWAPAKETSIQDGAIQFKNDGNVFSIPNLGGATSGEWTLTCEHNLPKGASLVLSIVPMAVSAKSGDTIHLSLAKDLPASFTLPPKTQQVTITCKANNLQGNTVTLKNLQILRKK